MSVIVRLQNLPWAAVAADIRQFFNGLSIPDGGVNIVGGELGDAFIAFSTDEDARLAMLRDGGKIKDGKIKLLLSSRAEMQKETTRQQSLQVQYLQMQQLQSAQTIQSVQAMQTIPNMQSLTAMQQATAMTMPGGMPMPVPGFPMPTSLPNTSTTTVPNLQASALSMQNLQQQMYGHMMANKTDSNIQSSAIPPGTTPGMNIMGGPMQFPSMTAMGPFPMASAVAPTLPAVSSMPTSGSVLSTPATCTPSSIPQLTTISTTASSQARTQQTLQQQTPVQVSSFQTATPQVTQAPVAQTSTPQITHAPAMHSANLYMSQPTNFQTQTNQMSIPPSFQPPTHQMSPSVGFQGANTQQMTPSFQAGMPQMSQPPPFHAPNQQANRLPFQTPNNQVNQPSSFQVPNQHANHPSSFQASNQQANHPPSFQTSNQQANQNLPFQTTFTPPVSQTTPFQNTTQPLGLQTATPKTAPPQFQSQTKKPDNRMNLNNKNERSRRSRSSSEESSSSRSYSQHKSKDRHYEKDRRRRRSRSRSRSRDRRRGRRDRSRSRERSSRRRDHDRDDDSRYSKRKQLYQEYQNPNSTNKPVEPVSKTADTFTSSNTNSISKTTSSAVATTTTTTMSPTASISLPPSKTPNQTSTSISNTANDKSALNSSISNSSLNPQLKGKQEDTPSHDEEANKNQVNPPKRKASNDNNYSQEVSNKNSMRNDGISNSNSRFDDPHPKKMYQSDGRNDYQSNSRRDDEYDPQYHKTNSSNYSEPFRFDRRKPNVPPNCCVLLKNFPIFNGARDVLNFFHDSSPQMSIKFQGNVDSSHVNAALIRFVNYDDKMKALKRDGFKLKKTVVSIAHVDDRVFDEADDRDLRRKMRSMKEPYDQPAFIPHNLKTFSCLVFEGTNRVNPVYNAKLTYHDRICSVFNQFKPVDMFMYIGQGKSQAFIRFENPSSAMQARNSLEGFMVNGICIKIMPCSDEQFSKFKDVAGDQSVHLAHIRARNHDNSNKESSQNFENSFRANRNNTNESLNLNRSETVNAPVPREILNAQKAEIPISSSVDAKSQMETNQPQNMQPLMNQLAGIDNSAQRVDSDPKRSSDPRLINSSITAKNPRFPNSSKNLNQPESMNSPNEASMNTPPQRTLLPNPPMQPSKDCINDEPLFDSNCIIMQGLPRDIHYKDIVTFFSSINIQPVQIHVMVDNGVPIGDAFCEFNNRDEAVLAAKKNNCQLGANFIHVRLVTQEELNKAVGKDLKPDNQPLPPPPPHAMNNPPNFHYPNVRPLMGIPQRDDQNMMMVGNGPRPILNNQPPFSPGDFDQPFGGMEASRPFGRGRGDLGSRDNNFPFRGGMRGGNRGGGFHRGRGGFERGGRGGFERGGRGSFERAGRGGYESGGRGGFESGGRGGFDSGGRGGFESRGRGGFERGGMRGGRGRGGSGPPHMMNQEMSRHDDQPPPTAHGDHHDDLLPDSNVEEFGKPGCVVAAENIPFRADVNDIIDFFRDYRLVPDSVIRRYDEDGQVTGDARIAFETPSDAKRAVRKYHKCFIFGRSIFLSLV